MQGLETLWSKRKTTSDLQTLKLSWVSSSKRSLCTCSSSEQQLVMQQDKLSSAQPRETRQEAGEKEARNKSWHLCKVCGVPELCGTQPYTTGVRLEQHPATSALWNPKWRVPFLPRSQTPIRKTGSLLPLPEHMSLIKHGCSTICMAWLVYKPEMLQACYL